MTRNAQQERASELAFASWVSGAAQAEFQSLSQPTKSFLNPMFQDERLADFWNDFAKAGRGFFCELYMHLLFSNVHFERACEEHENLEREAFQLDDRIQAISSIEKRLSSLPDDKELDKALMKNKYDLSHDIWQHNKRRKRLTKKNPLRPRTRESFNADKRARKRAEYMARALYSFFQKSHIQEDWKKTSARLKGHVCDIVDVLIDRPDDPLTISALTDLINNFQKRL